VDCPDFDAALFDSYAEIGAGYEDMSGLRLVVQRSSRDALDGKEKGELQEAHRKSEKSTGKP